MNVFVGYMRFLASLAFFAGVGFGTVEHLRGYRRVLDQLSVPDYETTANSLLNN